jgi:UDP-3-O-[3-hydroxymyristoyl] glucosamine N-acyltransferase
MKLTIGQLGEHLGARAVGDAAGLGREITCILPVDAANNSAVTFVTDARHNAAVATSKAAAVIVGEPIDDLPIPQLVVQDVNAALIHTLKLFAVERKAPSPGVHASACIGRNVQLGNDVSIGPHVVVEDDVRIGAETVVAGGCTIGAETQIGARCRLGSNVVVYHGCRVGDRVVVQANSTIGSVGFGYVPVDGVPKLIPHNGGVIIEDDVEIGANCCVDRAKFGNTIIGAGTKIDNLVQVAHNVVIGRCCLIAAQVGVAGSCRLGDGVVLAGQAGLADNIEIGAGTMVGAQAGVMSSVEAGRKLAWSPALEVREAARVVASVLRLPQLAQQVKRLTARVEQLEATEDHKE